MTAEGIDRVSQMPYQPKVIDVHMLDAATTALITENQGIELFDVSRTGEVTPWLNLEVEGRILHVVASGRTFLVHREDGRVVRLTLSCGQEDGPPSPNEAGGVDAGPMDVDVDMGTTD